MENFVRKPFVAGLFYPNDKKSLTSVIVDYLSHADRVDAKRIPKLIIIPHAGYEYSGKIAAWGYKQLLYDTNPSPHFVIIGPSHKEIFGGICGSSKTDWQTPLGQYTQQPFYQTNPNIFIDDDIHHEEHSIEVQVPFLQTIAPNGSMTCIVTGGNENIEQIAAFLIKTYDNSTFVISSDLSHYLDNDQAHEKDKKTIDAILNNNKEYLFTQQNCACGMTGILIGMEIAWKRKWKPILLSYDTSASAHCDTNRVVGYTSIGFYE